jgi:D-tagatose-1,6-bisphosphate aldolase subunit GatZ/KbaZ
MMARDFAGFVLGLAREMEFELDKLLLGGDHLGPNTWQHLASKEAMKKAKVLVREYVKAGFQKIHLDASMFLADDHGDRTKPLADEIVAARTAELCLSAEQAWEKFRHDCPKPMYIIGTEVPVPGGSRQNEAVNVTLPEDAARTIAVARQAFCDRQLQSAWQRVCGVVVQPGVEFSDDQVIDYIHEAVISLSREIKNHSNLVYEAHSTDYQTPQALAQMVPDHFCILKVGPWLTFAYREALFALAQIEKDLYEDKPDRQSFLRRQLEKIMVGNPKHWERYYSGSEGGKRLKRKFSYLDRSRYYWPDESLGKITDKLYSNLRKTGIPLALISQYLPNQYLQIRQGRINCDPEALVFSKIREVLAFYSEACCVKNNSVNTYRSIPATT